MIASVKARLAFHIRLYRTTLVVRQTPRRRNQDAFSTKYIKGFKEVSLDEILIIESETLLKNINRDEVRILNFIVNIINY
jgi:hypothetical protein